MKQRLRDDACCNPGTGSEPRIPNAAAQTRIVSGGAFWPSQGELSRHLKYIARARIPEFDVSPPQPRSRVSVGYIWLAKKNVVRARKSTSEARGPANDARFVREALATFLSWGRPSVLVCASPPPPSRFTAGASGVLNFSRSQALKRLCPSRRVPGWPLGWSHACYNA